MMQREPSSVWWEHVSGPAQLVLETVNILRTGKSVLLRTDDTLPYRDVFYQSIADSLRDLDSDLLLEEIADFADPAVGLIEHFNFTANYRKSISPTEFLQKREALANKLISVVLSDNVLKWLEFTASYRSSSVKQGLFIMEAKDVPFNMGKFKDTVRVLEYSGFVTEYDKFSFSGLMSGLPGANFFQRRYAATVAAFLIGDNIEHIPVVLHRNILEEDPKDFFCDPACSDELIAQSLWNAQVQELFPLVTRETRSFIASFRQQLEEVLSYINDVRCIPHSEFPNGLRNANKELVASPDDMEIGDIRYLIHCRRQNTDGQYVSDHVLFIPDEAVRERIELLRRTRNYIAHGKVCPVEDVAKLLTNDGNLTLHIGASKGQRTYNEISEDRRNLVKAN